MTNTKHRARRWLASLAGASLIVSGLAAGSAAADQPLPQAPAPTAKADIAQEVLEDLDASGEADFWVRFDARPDMSQFSKIADWDARGWAVYDALTSTAAESQAEALLSLRASGTDYEAFFITNAIKVNGGDATTVNRLAALPGVDAIYPSFEVLPPDPVEEESSVAPSAVAWGVADINAPEVWAQGITGQGMVLATIDTGVMYDHPALVDNYRGNNGDGTFDHNYNWFNAGHGNPNFPNDGNGHGTHVQGTMVGDDGGDNQIGVAPGATWIAANGCCPSDAALMGSGQWTLAPTDLNGQNPDPSKRPHVINNSWGTTLPDTQDPFFEDISEAWEAAGQFGVFANGNSGPGCSSSGSPGSRTLQYSVGNYNSAHQISNTSARGPGQDGVIKPDISAPGSAIYSAWPNGSYNTISGTSMASPHVAGAVGLLWSASPALMGDVEATRALLDSTAIDTENLQCGGTAANNNVFGEGRLDVAELIAQAPMDAGTLTGTVTDSSSGDALSGATVTVTGPLDRTATTNDTGAYTLALSEGDYTVEVSAYGYASATASVTITEDETTTHDVALVPVPSGTVSGTVTDGSGLGGPLAATVSVAGTPVSTTTDPATGAYSLSVPVGDYTITAAAAGYHDGTQEISVTTAGATANFALEVDVVECSVPGYSQVRTGLTETFDATTVPTGWEVTDDQGNGQVWRFDNPGNRTNLTGGSGGFAIVDNDWYGTSGIQRTGLVTPVLDLSDATDPVLEFKQDFRVFSGTGDQWGDVDLSLDGGATWTNLRRQVAEARGPATVLVPLEGAAGQDDVRVRFYDVDEGWSWWWQVDDVFVGEIACVPDELVEGPVIDVDPSEVTSTQAQETTTTHEITVANTGTADLTWTVTEAEAGSGAAYAPGAPDASLVLPQGADRSRPQPDAAASAPATVAPAAVPAVASLTEGFDNVTGLPGAGWAMANNSEPVGAIGWFQGNPDVFTSQQGAPDSYVGVNFNSAGNSPGHISNWLMTPELDLVNGSELTFWTRGEISEYADRLEVRMSTSGASTNVGTGYDGIGDFTEQLLVINEDLGDEYPGVWTSYTVTVEGLEAPTTGRLAFHYHVPNGGPNGVNSDYIGIDTVSYEAAAVPPTCDSPTDIPWLSATPTSGTTTAGGSSTVDVSLDATGLAIGDYEALLCIASNDPETPLVEVPVAMTVTEASEPTAPVIGVDPATVDSTQEQDETTTHEVDITNTGGADLTWTVTEAEAEAGSGAAYAPGAPDATLVLPQGTDRSGAQPESTETAQRMVAPANVSTVASLTEGFDDITTLPGAGWAITNNSEPVGTNTWFQGNPVVFPSHQGAENAYAAVNWASAGEFPGHISNWLMTPELDLVNGSELTFWTRSIASQFPDRLEVRMSTNGASTNVGTGYDGIGDFTERLLVINEDLGDEYPGVWESYTVTVEGLEAPTTGRLAFRYFVPDGGPAGDNSDFIGIDTLSYEAADAPEPTQCDTPTDIAWLSVTPTSGTTAPGATSTLDVTLDATGLAAGDYEALLCIASNDPETPLVEVPVTMTVTEIVVPPTFPEIDVDPVTVTSTQEQGESTTHDVDIANTGDADLTWEVTEAATACTSPSDIAWLSASPLSGTTAPGATSTLAVTLDATGLAAGGYEALLCIASNDPDNPVVQVAVTLTVSETAPPELIVDRLFGQDRYATAAAISQELHEPGVDVVYVATGAAYADALAGSALAGSEEVPVLLTRGDHLPAVTAAELARLEPGEVVLFGGTGAINATVADLIGAAADAPVTRLSGPDRYATAAAIAGEFTDPDVVYVATGEEFADALAGAARAGALDAPVLLVRSDHLPAATASALTDLAPSQIRVLGGTGAVSEDVATALGAYGTVTRISGGDRYETAVQITADYSSADTVYLASGVEWPDALAGGALAGAVHEPLLLTRPDLVPLVIGEELQRLAPPRVVIFGGTGAVSEEVVEDLHELLP